MPELIQVAARVRPTDDPSDVAVSTDEKLKRVTDGNGRSYTYDAVFGMAASQDTVFNTTAKPIIEACVNGYNGTVFVYGQTGSGKTYTMLGVENADGALDVDKRGLIPRSLELLFDMLEKEREKKGHTFRHECRLSFVELYNEELYDLLEEKSNDKLRLRQMETVIVEGAAEKTVEGCEDAITVLMQGWKNREVAETAMNRESSRSHAIFMISLETTCEYNGIINRKRSRINLVDLAGSERQENTKSSGARLKEAASINKSLSVLARVIDRLSQNAIKRERIHVPYRDSKLTHLLSDSLGGNARTAVIVNVHPNSRFLAQTVSTLKFAENVKTIENVAKVNEDVTSRDIEAWKAEIMRLKKELALAQESSVSKDDKLRAEERENEYKEQTNTLMNSLIDCQTRLKSSEEMVAIREQNIALLLEIQKDKYPDLAELFKEYEKKCLATLADNSVTETPVRSFDALTVQGLKKELRAARKENEDLRKQLEEDVQDGNVTFSGESGSLSSRQRKERRRTRYTPHDNNVNARQTFQPVVENANPDTHPVYLNLQEDVLQEQLNALKKEKEEMAAELQKLKETLQQKEQEHQEAVANFNEEKSSIQFALDEIRVERDVLADSTSAIQMGIALAEADLLTATEEKDMLVKNIADQEGKIKELSEARQALESDRAELIKSREEYKTQLEQITRATEDRLEEEKKTLGEAFAAKEKEMRELKENLKTKEQELGRANDLIAELKKDQLELAK
uniref:Kinesin-like protein n=1 Tax=Steinernema glaseri TaxID=37863 RepID=A0A1I7YCN8_9BILA